MLVRRWALPWLTTFVSSAAATLAVTAGAPGCQTRCFSAFDCGEGSFCNDGRCEIECFVDDDCIHPPDCRDNPLACPSRGVRCNALGRCVRGRGTKAEGPVRQAFDNSIPTVVDGWEATPGTGDVFVANSLAIAQEDRGFDLDGKCREAGDCVDNALAPLGAYANEQIDQGLRGGETLLLIELAGLERPFQGSDETFTAKFYAGRDGDDRFDSSNNFGPPRGSTDGRCCEFRISPQSVSGVVPQARSRAPARVLRGQLRSLAPAPLSFVITIGSPPHPELRLEKVLMSGRLPSNLTTISDGLLGGAVPANNLARIENPYCRTLNNLCPQRVPDSTLIDAIAGLFQPDVDLDVPADELSRLTVGTSGRVDECRTGGGAVVGPLIPGQPHTCAQQPEMIDGYSAAFTFSAVAARVVGVGQ